MVISENAGERPYVGLLVDYHSPATDWTCYPVRGE